MERHDGDAGFWIDRLRLERHPEGGYYRQTYRCPEELAPPGLPPRFGGPRPFSTAIYFLLEAGDVSVLHRLQSDELWFHHAGGTALVHALTGDGTLHTQRLGRELDRGDALQAQVERGVWFGAEVAPGAPYVLGSCTVSPGFDFAEFEMARRAELLAQFPEHHELIERLARP